MYDAILPAGGRIHPPFSLRVGTNSKALIDFGGRTILARTLNALADSGQINRTVLIGTPEVLAHKDAALASHLLEEGTSGPDNIYRGLDMLLKSGSAPDKVMVVTTDLPFLNGGIIEKYLSLVPSDKDILVPLIQRHEFDERFPGTTSTFVTLRSGSYTLGGMFVMSSQALLKSRPHIERVFENRKSKLGMARMLGPAFVAKWFAKQLTLKDVENKIQSMLGLTGSAVLGCPPELAFDIDDEVDYNYAISKFPAAATAGS